jgi:aspartyl aminopeptidase
MHAGLVIKHNANQRYATDGVTAFLFREAGRLAGVPCQEFVVRSDLACGSTIGPIIASTTGMRAVDVGAPMLSMHSIREMCGADDVSHAVAHFVAAFEHTTRLDAALTVDKRAADAD